MNIIQLNAFKKFIPFIATFSIVIFIFWITYDDWYQFKNITTVSVITIFWLSILLISIEILNGYKVNVLLKPFGIKLKIIEWIGLDFIRAFGNYLPFSAGIVSNSVYLKYKKNLPLTKFFGHIVGSIVIMLFTYGILNVFFLLIRYLVYNDLNITLFTTSLTFVVIAIVMMSTRVRKIESNNKIINWLKDIHNSWCLIKEQKGLVFKITVLQTLIITCLALRYAVVFQELRYDIDIFAIFILTVMTTVIRFASLFPGNLGFREVLSGGVVQMFGLSFSDGILVAVIIRITEMFWIFLFGTIFSFVLASYDTHPKNNQVVKNHEE